VHEGLGGYNIDLKNVDAKSELFRTNRFMSQMMHEPSLDALTLSESLLRTCLAAPRETVFYGCFVLDSCGPAEIAHSFIRWCRARLVAPCLSVGHSDLRMTAAGWRLCPERGSARGPVGEGLREERVAGPRGSQRGPQAH
jgi:hypothetical protein